VAIQDSAKRKGEEQTSSSCVKEHWTILLLFSNKQFVIFYLLGTTILRIFSVFFNSFYQISRLSKPFFCFSTVFSISRPSANSFFKT
jgi:hypothetical protein